MLPYPQIDPVAIAIGPLKIHWYGLMYLLGFGVAWWIGRRRVHAGRFPGVDDSAFGDLLFYGMLGVVLGGRVGYVLFYAFGEFLADPLFLLRINEGGMSFHGGLLGVMIAALWWSHSRRLHFFDTMDFVAPLVPPGLGFGRLGNYIGGELWGKPTEAGWGVPKRRRAISEGVAAIVTRILEQNVQYGTGTRANIGRPAAGKTGTNEEYADAWFAGYTPNLATTVWVGYTRGEIPMESVHGIAVSGGSFPAEIWALFMDDALDGVPETEFPEPDRWPTWKPFTRGKYALTYDPSATTDETETETTEEPPPPSPSRGLP